MGVVKLKVYTLPRYQPNRRTAASRTFGPRTSCEAFLFSIVVPFARAGQSGLIARFNRDAPPKPPPAVPICGNSLSQNRSAARPAASGHRPTLRVF